MFIISGGKGTGKTRALIEKVKAENGVLVCNSPEAMRDRAYSYGITGLDLISYSDFYNGNAEEYGKPVFIHDINSLIKYYSHEIKGYSICNE
jgi:hypothetical protein